MGTPTAGPARMTRGIWFMSRPGFYAAPIGAPAALSLSGLMGFLSERVRANQPGTSPTVAGFPAGRAVAALTGASLLGTVSECRGHR